MLKQRKLFAVGDCVTVTMCKYILDETIYLLAKLRH